MSIKSDLVSPASAPPAVAPPVCDRVQSEVNPWDQSRLARSAIRQAKDELIETLRLLDEPEKNIERLRHHTLMQCFHIEAAAEILREGRLFGVKLKEVAK